MTEATDLLELGGMRLLSGEGRRMELGVTLPGLTFGEDDYLVLPEPVAVVVDISKTTGDGFAFRLRYEATISGPCMRCLEPAAPVVAIDIREVDQPGGGEDLESPYMDDQVLNLAQWAADSLTLALPPLIVCRPDCLGLCAECGTNLNTAGPEHVHDKPVDPRWAKLSDLDLG